MLYHLSYATASGGKCLRWGSNPRPWDYETHALPTAPQRLKTLRHRGIEPRPSRWQRDIITTRLMTRLRCIKRGEGRIELPTSPTRTENHATRPFTRLCVERKVLPPRIELGTYCVLGSRHNQLDHESIKVWHPRRDSNPQSRDS